MPPKFDALSQEEREHFSRVCLLHGWIQNDFIVTFEYLPPPSGEQSRGERNVIVEAKANGARAGYVNLDSAWIGQFEDDLMSGEFGDAPDPVNM